MPTSLAAPDFSYRGYSHATYTFARPACVRTGRSRRLSLRKRRTKHLAHVVPLARLLVEHLHSLEMLTLSPAERQKLQTSLAPLKHALVHARYSATPTKASPHR